ncbi:SDR family oxidoreductase [Allokutzneria sp. A3M-2-11 16]|uniref:NAD(P)-dependent oxidoreductase n=1 Tax=Allokutzneria sp. A3M-2-11 16 TaxID=2962043 RepID=UPI0020B8D69A|nr:NAD(P)-binding oxidoreductase [Allokutzneria sp. A3M-2-11 16]MCP3805292.1 SDR family oxidoreductase [Allokutzneria sp. A3M-2-11 16]
MRLVVLGASGGLGRAVVELALLDGHSVTAFVRDGAALGPPSAGLSVVVGDVLDPASLEGLFIEVDAVVSALGSPGNGPSVVRSLGCRNVVDAMERQGAGMLAAASVAAVEPGVNPMALTSAMAHRQVLKDVRGMEEAITESTLDWVIVRAPKLTDGPATGNYRFAKRRPPLGGVMISRADMAEAMLSCVHGPGRRYGTVAVAY